MSILVVVMGEIKTVSTKELETILVKKGLYIVISKTDNYSEHNVAATSVLMKKKDALGLYVTLNSPYKKVLEDLKKNKIETKKLYFIDGASKVSKKEKEADSCTYLESNSSLTNLSLVISASIKTGKFSFLFFDSISTLLVYNNFESTQRFLHYLINNIRNQDLTLVLRAVEEEKTNKLLPILSQFCDKCIFV